MACSGQKLYLLRHGEAGPAHDDDQRRLTPGGRQKTDALGEILLKRGVRVDEILHSDKRRAEETAYIIAAYIEPESGVRQISGLRPNDAVEPMIELIQAEDIDVMYVGHLPFMGYLADALQEGESVHRAVEFPTTGLACFEYQDNGWKFQWCIPEQPNSPS